MMYVNVNALKSSGFHNPDIYLNYHDNVCRVTVKNEGGENYDELMNADFVEAFLAHVLNELKNSGMRGVARVCHNSQERVKSVNELMTKLNISFKNIEVQFESPGKGRRISLDSSKQINNKLTVSPKYKFETRKNKRILIKHEHLSLGEDFKGGFDILNLLSANYYGWLSQVQDAVKDLVPGDLVVIYQSGFEMYMFEAISNIATYASSPNVLQYRIENSKVVGKFVLSLMGNLRTIETSEADVKFFGEIKETLKKDMHFDPFA